MQQPSMDILAFQRKFATERACRKHLFKLRWPDGYRCPRCGHEKYSYHSTRRLYQCKACKYQVSLTAGTVFHRTRTPLRKWFWMIFLMSRQKSGVSMLSLQRMLKIRTYKTVWLMGHKIRKAMADRDAHWKLGGLVEMDDSYFGGSKPGKRGRGASKKSKVVIAVEDKEDRAGFMKMAIVKRLTGKEIPRQMGNSIDEQSTVKTDGWRSYIVLQSRVKAHEQVVVGKGPRAAELLPWVHTMIANAKGVIRGVYHGVNPKHLSFYLAAFCYRTNRRFWESQLFNRLLNACLSTTTITFAELKA